MKGFSLLEVMVAIAILAVSFLAIFGLQSTTLVGSLRSQRVSIATELGRGKMARTLVDLEAGIVKGEFPEEKEDSGDFEEDKYPEYKWKVTVKKVDIPAPPAAEDGGDVMTRVFEMVSKQLSEASREVKLVVSFEEEGGEGEEKKLLELTTHIVKM